LRFFLRQAKTSPTLEEREEREEREVTREGELLSFVCYSIAPRLEGMVGGGFGNQFQSVETTTRVCTLHMSPDIYQRSQASYSIHKMPNNRMEVELRDQV